MRTPDVPTRAGAVGALVLEAARLARLVRDAPAVLVVAALLAWLAGRAEVEGGVVLGRLARPRARRPGARPARGLVLRELLRVRFEMLGDGLVDLLLRELGGEIPKA